MNWTREKPTTEGWYWWRDAEDGTVIVTKVRRYEEALEFHKPHWACGDPIPELVATDNGEWAGPLEQPT